MRLAGLQVGATELPVCGGSEEALDALAASEADVLAVAGDSALPPGALKTLAWGLEGTGVDLTVAPAVTEVVMPTATATRAVTTSTLTRTDGMSRRQ